MSLLKNSLKIGVVGVGHLGYYHTRTLTKLNNAVLAGVQDSDAKRAKSVAEEFGTKAFVSLEALLEEVDAVVLATPTATHSSIGMQVLGAKKDMLVEKPIASSSDEGRLLTEKADENGLVLGVGHIEAFNPAWEAALPYLDTPIFVEAHRLTAFRGRGADVPVVLDLMVHDIGLLLPIAGKIESVHSAGAAVISDSLDICNARLGFSAGCVANLTASRISAKPLRKMRFFLEGGYISVDFAEHSVEVLSVAPLKGAVAMDAGGLKLYRITPSVPPKDAIEAELSDFIHAVRTRGTPRTSGTAALRALEAAERVERAIGT